MIKANWQLTNGRCGIPLQNIISRCTAPGASETFFTLAADEASRALEPLAMHVDGMGETEKGKWHEER